MKTSLLLSAVVGLAFVSSASAQSTLEKIEDKTKQAVRATGNALEKAARKTGQAVENVTNSAEEKLTRNPEKTTTTTTTTVNRDTRVVESDISNSTIYQQVERELGKPLSPEQRAQYAAAWQAALDKTRTAEMEFADQISAITTVPAAKTQQIVYDIGL